MSICKCLPAPTCATYSCMNICPMDFNSEPRFFSPHDLDLIGNDVHHTCEIAFCTTIPIFVLWMFCS